MCGVEERDEMRVKKEKEKQVGWQRQGGPSGRAARQ